MKLSHLIEIVTVLFLYVVVFFTVVGPAVESVMGFEMLSAKGRPGSIERNWELVSKPQGWLLCLGYVPIHFTYLFVRARLTGEPTESYWD
jgi:hypothetical protein